MTMRDALEALGRTMLERDAARAECEALAASRDKANAEWADAVAALVEEKRDTERLNWLENPDRLADVRVRMFNENENIREAIAKLGGPQ